MPRNSARWLLRLLFAWLALIVVTSHHQLRAADDQSVESIEQFMDRKVQWNSLVGATFRLEGRVGTITPQKLQFHRCDGVEFRLKANTPALPRSTRVAEITGTLSKEDGKFYFDVTDARVRSTDLDLLAERQTKLNSNKPTEWFNLADWAEHRGDFYQDPELRDRAASLREIGLMIEYRKLKLDDVDGLLELAARAKKMHLDESLGWRLIHEASRQDLARQRRADKPDESVVLDRILKNLPGSNVPLATEDLPLRETYKANPLTVYAEANTDLRKKLNRVLYLEVLQEKVERDALSTGKNGDAIANRLQQQAPELASVAQKYREKELVYLTENVKSLTRDQVVALAKRFTDSKRPEDAKAVQTEWLKAQEPQRRKSGASGLLQLADDYVRLVGDLPTATIFAEEAWKANPDSPEAGEWMTAHKLVYYGEHWIPADAVPAEPEDEFLVAIREGRVIAGMTETQVRQALGAKPTSVVREATRAKISELWVYSTQGIVISLVRPLSQKEAIVDKVNSIVQ